jgi:beta-glucosidase
MKNELLKFPDYFLWGSGTSAHQVEGHNVNDWSQWEVINSKKLAKEARSIHFSKMNNASHAPLWEEIRNLAEDPENYISGKACDHYTLYARDINLAKQLNQTAHRISIEWSRVEPEEGKFNQDEIEHYRSVIVSMKEHNIEPFVTLWHFTNPVWVRDKGGWKAKESIKYFSRYVQRVVEDLRNNVNYWITINEPMVYAASSYLFGRFPAGEKNPVSFFLAINNFIKAHRAAYEAIKEVHPESQVGIAKSVIYFEAYKNRVFNLLLKKAVDWFWNNYFLNQIKFYQDFIGVNHYFHNRINYGFNKNENKKLSDLAWELYPEAIYYSLKDVQKYMKPIYITENGLADAEDNKRSWYIREVLKHVHRAIEENIDVRGYFYWSLLDNFEWHKGFWPRFGLVEVDYNNLKRKIRESAIEYAKIIADNGFNPDGYNE